MEICYRVTLTVVRKLEDLQPIIRQDARIRHVKKAYLDAEASNARYLAFSKGENYVAPRPEYDQFGIRVTPSQKDVEIGDIEIKESRYNTITLIQQLCSCLLFVIRFFNHPSPEDPVVTPAMPLPGAERARLARPVAHPRARAVRDAVLPVRGGGLQLRRAVQGGREPH